MLKMIVGLVGLWIGLAYIPRLISCIVCKQYIDSVTTGAWAAGWALATWGLFL